VDRRTVATATVSCLLLAAAMITGCAASSPGGTYGGSGASTKVVELTAADNGKTVDADIGSTLVVKLEGNPTTGYTWSTDGSLPPIVKEDGAASYEASSSAIGAGGTMMMTYSATQAGSGDLKLKYWRTFEPTVPPVATFQVMLKVK